MASNWDKLWSTYGGTSFSTDFQHNMIFKTYRKLLDGIGISEPDALEIGCGSGELAARILKTYGGTATLMDSSKPALALAERIFKQHGLKARFVHADMFKFKPAKKYDIVHSEGLIEHFVGADRKAAIDAHKRCAKKGGYVLVCVPRPVWYYNVWRKGLEKKGNWPYGFESPFGCEELRAALENSGLTVLKSFNKFRFAFALAKV